MKICSKCKLEKPLSDYQTYYHRREDKIFTRGHCTECLYLTRKNNKMKQVSTPIEIVPPVVLKLEPEVVKVKTSKEKTCVECFVTKSLDDFYKGRMVCRRCCTEREKKVYKDKTYERLDNNGGSLRIPIKPGKYNDEYQKHYTYEILLAMGWKLNEENGKWWKEGVKTKDGLFIKVKKLQRAPYVLPKMYTLDQKMEKIIIGIQLRNEGKTFGEIGKIIEVSGPTVSKWLRDYENK